jgi:hypothetical protein
LVGPRGGDIADVQRVFGRRWWRGDRQARSGIGVGPGPSAWCWPGPGCPRAPE